MAGGVRYMTRDLAWKVLESSGRPYLRSDSWGPRLADFEGRGLLKVLVLKLDYTPRSPLKKILMPEFYPPEIPPLLLA